MERSMNGLLYEAAREGNVENLLELLRQDPLILDRFMTSCSTSDTPLHIASMLGHTDFVNETLKSKPELVRELNPQRSSPLHLASAKGYVEIVEALVRVDPGVCLDPDAEGRNPLHLAAIKGHVQVLRVLLVHANRDAARATMGSDGGNILHVAVKYKQLQVLELLVGELGDDHQFLNAGDDYGMTVLHRAVFDKQVEITNFLLMNTRIEVNAVNANGFTALDILKQSIRDVRDFEIGESLRNAGAITSSPPQLRPSIFPLLYSEPRKPIGTSSPHTQTKPTASSQEVKNVKKNGDWLTRKQGSLMVVASLLATIAFQAALTPPGGLWQDTTLSSQAPAASPPAQDDNNGNGHLAGSSIMADNYNRLYSVYLISNTVGFLASLSIILLLITGLPCMRRFCMWLLTVIMWVAITAMALTYMISIIASTKQGGHIGYIFFGVDVRGTVITYVTVFSIYAWMGIMALLVFVHTIRLIFLFVRGCFGLLVPKRRSLPLANH